MSLTIGKAPPPFALPSHDGSTVALEQLRGKRIVLYFYPKDDTPGCTREACAFRDEFAEFRKLNATIVGISADSVESHAKFRKKYKLPFTLLSDPDHAVAERYGVWQKKKMFGVSFMGIVRTTFLIDASGILRHAMPVKRVDPHAGQVLELLTALPDS